MFITIDAACEKTIFRIDKKTDGEGYVVVKEKLGSCPHMSEMLDINTVFSFVNLAIQEAELDEKKCLKGGMGCHV